MEQPTEIKKAGKSAKHKELQKTAIGWLYAQGCSVFAEEVPTGNGVADALGIRTRDKDDHRIYYIEAKASRSDLICAKQRGVYLRSIGGVEEKCYWHTFRGFDGLPVRPDNAGCEHCIGLKNTQYDTGVDFYYLIVADGVKVEDSLYPEWGVLNEKGYVVRRAKRMKREIDSKAMIENIAHVLVYKVFGKLYMP